MFSFYVSTLEIYIFEIEKKKKVFGMHRNNFFLPPGFIVFPLETEKQPFFFLIFFLEQQIS